MMRHPTGVLCDRARAWAALAPDGELSELERKLLGSHLDRCGACAASRCGSPPSPPSFAPPRCSRCRGPISVPVWRRRPVYSRLSAVGAAAAVAVMAFGVSARAPLSPSESDRLPRVTNFASNAEREVALIIRRAENDNARSRLRSTVEGIVTRPI